MTRRSGFTLIELLAVVAIAAVLAAIVFGLSQTAVKKTQRAGSLSNMRTISSLAELYAADHDGHIAPFLTYEWNSAYKNMEGSYMFEFLPRFYGGENFRIFRRPGDDLTYMDGVGIRSYKGVVMWSYARNNGLPRKIGSTDPTFKRPLLTNPARTMMFLETMQSGGLEPRNKFKGQVHFDREGPEGKCAVTFVDGHSELLTRESLGVTADGSWSMTPASRELWYGDPDASAPKEY